VFAYYTYVGKTIGVVLTFDKFLNNLSDVKYRIPNVTDPGLGSMYFWKSSQPSPAKKNPPRNITKSLDGRETGRAQLICTCPPARQL
jgi:hypothetical protein